MVFENVSPDMVFEKLPFKFPYMVLENIPWYGV